MFGVIMAIYLQWVKWILAYSAVSLGIFGISFFFKCLFRNYKPLSMFNVNYLQIARLVTRVAQMVFFVKLFKNILLKTSSPKGNDRSPDSKSSKYLNSSQVKDFLKLVMGSLLRSPWLDPAKF